MKQEYTFFNDGTIVFDDTRSVKELIAHAFEMFDYYEPFGMDIVTLFQCHHPNTSTGWFTTDVNMSCADEIKNPGELCFAYHLPDVFYFAEGGWGHHMKKLGNHPIIPNAVELKLRFEDFNNTVMMNGTYCFMDIIRELNRVGYISDDCKCVKVLLVGCGKKYSISFSDPIMKLPLTDFVSKIQEYHAVYTKLGENDFVYYEVFEIC